MSVYKYVLKEVNDYLCSRTMQPYAHTKSKDIMVILPLRGLFPDINLKKIIYYNKMHYSSYLMV